MKVRAIGGTDMHHEVLEESANYYIGKYGLALSKNQWEPVPTERWVDVTGECDVKNSLIFHRGIDVNTAQWFHLGTYRICKKVVGFGGESVLIVEKKEAR